MKLLLSAYACEPNRGSEPGVGWAWALGMAQRHETYVLTRANNRGPIEKELDRLQMPLKERPRFLWVDLPGPFRWLKRKRILPVSLYYLLWQFAARRTFDKSGIQVDVIHHVTFNSYVVPGVWWNRKEKVVIGPLGGFSTTPVQFLRTFSWRRRVFEWIRNSRKWMWRFAPFFHMARASADAILFTEKQHAIEKGGVCAVVDAFLDAGLSRQLENPKWGESLPRKLQFVWAGSLEGWKACEIAIRAFAKAFVDIENSPRPSFIVFGSGSQFMRLKRLVCQLGINDAVVFRGVCPQEEVWREFQISRSLVFTSVRDTSGNVALESMGCGTPVICFNHQGVGEITDDACAIRISPNQTFDQAVESFAGAMKRLAFDENLVERMGRAARARAIVEFCWPQKFTKMDCVYERILNG